MIMKIESIIKYKIDPIPEIKIEELRNKTISEIKQQILNNRNFINNLKNYRNNLEKAKEEKLLYYNSGIVPQISQLFHAATNQQFSPIEVALRQIVYCETEEQIAQENIKKLELQKRMKELARVNDWWNENAAFISSHLLSSHLEEFKKAAFKELIAALEESETSFLEKAESLAYQFPKAA